MPKSPDQGRTTVMVFTANDLIDHLDKSKAPELTKEPEAKRHTLSVCSRADVR